MEKMENIWGVGGGGVKGIAPPPPFSKKVLKQNKKYIRQSSGKGKREKELQVCLVFKCTRVDTCTCVDKHFSFFNLLNHPPPPWKKFWIRTCYRGVV